MRKGKTAILIAGDAGRNKSMCVPGGGFATVKIELPAKWDALCAELGYAPLRSFYLRSDLKPVQPDRSADPYRRPGASGGQDRRRGNR